MGFQWELPFWFNKVVLFEKARNTPVDMHPREYFWIWTNNHPATAIKTHKNKVVQVQNGLVSFFIENNGAIMAMFQSTKVAIDPLVLPVKILKFQNQGDCVVVKEVLFKLNGRTIRYKLTRKQQFTVPIKK